MSRDIRNDWNNFTRGWRRSRNGQIYGVVAGFCEWRELPVEITRFLVLILIVATGIFPGLIIYILLALFLPIEDEESFYEQRKENRRKKKNMEYEDAKWSERSTEDIRKEYEELKKKVEDMESEMFDKEKDWDERFNSSEDK